MNRLAIFASYSNDNKIHDYVIYYLKGLKEVCDAIVFVADCNIEDSEKTKLKGLVNHAICQRHGCYDFGSYRRGFEWAETNGMLKDADELILCNDSCYGPVYPFSESFSIMKKRECDFWGMVESHAIRPHLQSYFLVFKRNVFNSITFHEFVSSFEHHDTFWDYVLYYETRFADILTKAGFKYDSFLDYNKYEKLFHGRTDNPIFLGVTTLKDHLPLVKRKLFGHEHRSILVEPIDEMKDIIKKDNPQIFEMIESENNAVVVIPVYKSLMSADETCSLKQCLKVLSRYDIRFVCPEGLDMSEYDNLIGYSLPKERFAKSYFDGIEGYNDLMTEQSFYKRFGKYKYMLIYQLDAWVFSDQLTEWCNKDYDYIGAPWFEKLRTHEEGYELWKCGNGGLSLRKIPKFIQVTEPSIIQAIKLKNPDLWEDTLFSYGFDDTEHEIKCPAAEEASFFSFECSPSYLYEKNNNTLPFGCHAWRKFEFDSFWHKFIDAPSTLNVSIITITYNDLAGFKATRDSIKCQDFDRYEWIVIDGGSTDGTKEYIEEHSEEMSYWQSKKDQGVYYAQNEGTQYAKGDYVIYMNSGDTFHDSKVLSHVFNKLHTADVIYGDWTQHLENGETRVLNAPHKVFFPYFLIGNICHQAMFIKTQVMKKSPYNTNYKLYADWAKWAELSYKGYTFEYVPYNICIFELGGLSSKSEYKNMKERKKIEKEFYSGSLREMSNLFNNLISLQPQTQSIFINNNIQELESLRKKSRKRLKDIRVLIYLCSFLFALTIVLCILLIW